MGLMDAYYNFQRQRAAAQARGQMEGRAAMAQENAPAFQALMGAPEVPGSVTTDPMGLTTEIPGMAATGLMAGDMADPMHQLQMGAGLMGIPGYQDMAQGITNNALQHMLTAPARARQQLMAQQAHQMKIMEFQARMAKMDREIADKDLANTSTWYKDYRADTEGLRDALMQSNTALARVSEVGLNDISNADLIGVMTGIAKLRDPGVALVQGDIDTLAAAKGWSGAERAILNMIKLDAEVDFEVRKQLAATLLNEQQSRQVELDYRRTAAANRAIEFNLRGADLLPEIGRPDAAAVRNRIAEPERRITPPGSTDGMIEPTDSVKRDLEKLEQETEAW